LLSYDNTIQWFAAPLHYYSNVESYTFAGRSSRSFEELLIVLAHSLVILCYGIDQPMHVAILFVDALSIPLIVLYLCIVWRHRLVKQRQHHLQLPQFQQHQCQ
jgi:hypothetical protein